MQWSQVAWQNTCRQTILTGATAYALSLPHVVVQILVRNHPICLSTTFLLFLNTAHLIHLSFFNLAFTTSWNLAPSYIPFPCRSFTTLTCLIVTGYIMVSLGTVTLHMLLHLSSFPVLGENTTNVTALPDIAQRQGFLTYSWLSTSIMICTQVDLLTAKAVLKKRYFVVHYQDYIYNNWV